MCSAMPRNTRSGAATSHSPPPRAGREVVIRVRDNGIGIPAELMPMIFNLFTQLDRTSGPPQSGLGIGLALVQRLVEMHGGSVSARSDGLGKGSEFSIRLPLFIREAVESGQPIQQLSALEQSMRTQKGPPAHNAASSWLTITTTPSRAWPPSCSSAGTRSTPPPNGAMALESAEQHRPEVALLDIGMPKLDGYEVARRIRAQPWGQRITLVALTGWGQDSDRRRSQEAGFDSHLVKPLDLDKLTELLAALPVAGSGRRAGRGPDAAGGLSDATHWRLSLVLEAGLAAPQHYITGRS